MVWQEESAEVIPVIFLTNIQCGHRIDWKDTYNHKSADLATALLN